MTIDNIRSDRIYHGAVSFAGTLTLPDQSVDNAAIKTGADVDSDKLEHKHPISVELAEQATEVVNIEKLIHVSRVTGSIVALEAAIVSVPGTGNSFTLDLQKSTGGGAFSSVLTSTLEFTSSSSALTPGAAVIDSSAASLADGDILKLVVSCTSDTNGNAEGLVVTVTLKEDAS